MAWFDRHPDRQWDRLAAGLLSADVQARLAEHARSCARCAPRYERARLLGRAFEGGDLAVPTASEMEHLERRALSQVLGQHADVPLATPAQLWSWVSGGLAVAVFSVLLFVVALRPGRPGLDDEFAPRGGAGSAVSVLRAFCARSGQPLSELKNAIPARCPVGANLAFAAGSSRPGFAAVLVRHGEQLSEVGSAQVLGQPGREHPLPFTLPVEGPEGAAELIMGFGPTEEMAWHAARTAPASDEERHTLKVQITSGSLP